MKLSTQKIIIAALISIVTLGGFEVLIYILNLNQPVIYLQLAFWIFLYLVVKIIFLFDLHFKKRGSWQRAKQKHKDVVGSFERNCKMLWLACLNRFEHLRKWKYFSQWLHFLLIPGFIFWASISLFYVNFGFPKIQQILALLSSAALVLDYWYLKEVFYRQKEIVDKDIFVILSVLKIYTAALLFAASMSSLRFYCLPPLYFSAEIFCYSFLLIYQALYQHRLITGKNIGITLAISLAMAIIGQFVYVFWGYNYFTAAIFLTACYNLFWGIFHYHLDKTLTWKIFWEILIISFIIAGMVLSVTNFRARILDGCQYKIF